MSGATFAAMHSPDLLYSRSSGLGQRDEAARVHTLIAPLNEAHKERLKAARLLWATARYSPGRFF